jgi:hypothetical protein
MNTLEWLSQTDSGVAGLIPRITLAVALLTFGCNAGSIAVPDAPEVRGTGRLVALTLYAQANANGRDSFAFDGRMVAPTIRVSPGDVLKIDYINHLPSVPTESCASEPCTNMTNLHFHGLTVSPNAPQDDVLDMMAMPGQTLRYSVQIPSDHQVFFGITRIRTERVTGRCSTACRVQSWLRALIDTFQPYAGCANACLSCAAGISSTIRKLL